MNSAQKYDWESMRVVFGFVPSVARNRGGSDAYADWMLHSFVTESALYMYLLWLNNQSNDTVHADFKALRDVAARLEDTPKPAPQTLTVAGVKKLEYLIAAAYATSVIYVMKGVNNHHLLRDFIKLLDEAEPHVDPQVGLMLRMLKYGRDDASRVVKTYVLWSRTREGLHEVCRRLRENPQHPKAAQDGDDSRSLQEVIGTLVEILDHPVALPNLALVRRDLAYFRESLP